MSYAKFKEVQVHGEEIELTIGGQVLLAYVKDVASVESLTPYAKNRTRVRFMTEVSASHLAPIQHEIIRGFASDAKHFSQFGKFPDNATLGEYIFHQSVALNPIVESGNYMWVFELEFVN
jgi:hypothetical protein